MERLWEVDVSSVLGCWCGKFNDVFDKVIGGAWGMGLVEKVTKEISGIRKPFGNELARSKSRFW